MRNPHLFLVAVAMALSLQATEYFADAVNCDDAADGLTAQTAKKTAQAAVDLAASNGDIVTLLPGDYATGSTAQTAGGVTSSSRICITNRITLRS